MKSDEPIPLRLTGAADAAAIRAALARASFDERTIADRLQVPNLAGLTQPLFKTFESRLSGDGLLEALTRLFIFGHALARADVSTHLPAADLEAFVAADLLRPWPADDPAGESLYSPIRLVPIRVEPLTPRDLIVAGDRNDRPDGRSVPGFPDIVFPGHSPLTRRFLSLLPAVGPKRVLELCSGSAVAALALSSAGARCTAADIAERSAHFARFNAWLNACPLDVACGDLYEAAKGSYDCVIVHPPYVPAHSRQLAYRDGGETGEAITERAVSGLPEHLEAGGTFHMLCLGMDTTDGRFEDRIRQWLGPASREFDVIFALDSTTAAEEIATRLSGPFDGSVAELRRWRELFERLQVKEFVYGCTVLRRFDPRAGEAITRRVVMNDETSAARFQWLLDFFDRMRAPDLHSRLLDAKPGLGPGVTLEVRHRTEGSGFMPDVYYLENGGHPFHVRLKIEAWLAAFLSELDGERTAREVFESARARGRVPDTFTDPELPRLLSYMGERNCITF